MIDRAAASDLIEKKQLYTSLDIGRTVEVENALHHPTEQGGKNIKVFALPVENNTAKKKKRGNDQEGHKAERRCTDPLISSNLL